MPPHRLPTTLLLAACAAIALSAPGGCAGKGRSPVDGRIIATAETDPVASDEDAADDPAIWVNRADPARSLVLGTDKRAGLGVYELDGRLAQFLPLGRVNNVDLMEQVPLGGRQVTLVGASHRTRGITLLTLDEKTRRLTEVPGSPFPIGLKKPYGFAFAQGSPRLFVSDEDGPVQAWAIEEGTPGMVALRHESENDALLTFGSKVEGMVGSRDDLFVAEEEVGIWRIVRDRNGGLAKTLFARTAAAGPVVPDVEGLAIFEGVGGRVLIASSQGDNTYAAFAIDDALGVAAGSYLGSFSIVDSAAVDGTQETDGIAVTGASLGAAFPAGLFVAQDGDNPGGRQNFKLVPWETIAAGLGHDLSRAAWRGLFTAAPAPD